MAGNYLFLTRCIFNPLYRHLGLHVFKPSAVSRSISLSLSLSYPHLLLLHLLSLSLLRFIFLSYLLFLSLSPHTLSLPPSLYLSFFPPLCLPFSTPSFSNSSSSSHLLTLCLFPFLVCHSSLLFKTSLNIFRFAQYGCSAMHHSCV